MSIKIEVQSIKSKKPVSQCCGESIYLGECWECGRVCAPIEYIKPDYDLLADIYLLMRRSRDADRKSMMRFDLQQDGEMIARGWIANEKEGQSSLIEFLAGPVEEPAEVAVYLCDFNDTKESVTEEMKRCAEEEINEI